MAEEVPGQRPVLDGFDLTLEHHTPGQGRQVRAAVMDTAQQGTMKDSHTNIKPWGKKLDWPILSYRCWTQCLSPLPSSHEAPKYTITHFFHIISLFIFFFLSLVSRTVENKVKGWPDTLPQGPNLNREMLARIDLIYLNGHIRFARSRLLSNPKQTASNKTGPRCCYIISSEQIRE